FHNRENGYDAGATYLILGNAKNIWGFKKKLSEADARFTGKDSYDAFGYYASGDGDINGDGFDDFLIGAPAGNAQGGPKPGHAFLFLGRPNIDWGYDCIAKDHADASFVGSHGYDHVGESVAVIGDVNQDGYDDFIIGAPFDDDGEDDGGKVYLFLGRKSGWHREMDIETADASFIGTHTNIWVGYTVSAAGDVNGDGLADFLIGSHHHEAVGGRIYLIFGRKGVDWGSNFNLYGADVIFQGESYGDKAGWSLACAGDVNNDGFSDLLIGAYDNDDGGQGAGKVYLILGKKTGWEKFVNLNNADASWIGERLEDNAGWSVSGLPDMNYDHCDEILIGSWLNDHSGLNAGKAYLINGKESGWMKNVKLRDLPDYFTGEYNGDYAGYCVAGNDANGDGLGDLWVSATYNSDYKYWGGKIHLFLSEREYSEINGQAVYFGNENPIPGVKIRIENEVSDSIVTDKNGKFFLQLPSYQSYSLAAFKSKNCDVGDDAITAYDAALILQSVVGLIQLDSLHQFIADITQNSTVTAYDASKIARYAVGIEDTSSCLGEWHFIPPQRSYSAIEHNYDDQNFTAFIMGDVDGSWRYPDSVAILSKVDFPIANKAGDRFYIPIDIAPNKNLISLELKFRYNPDQLLYVDIERSELIKDFQFITNVQSGKISLALFGAEPLIEGGTLCNLVFKAIDNSRDCKQIFIDKFQINNEPALSRLISFENKTQSFVPASFHLSQNYPNPFNNCTTITLSVQDYARVNLAIYNLNGDRVKVLVDRNLPADNYQFNWDGTDDCNNRITSGVYICRAVQENEIQSVKLLYIK
ncbi:MAG TPA: cohesin domain-containing protein, partial [bacterium]